MEPIAEKLPGPVYASWDEAMAAPDLDLSKPWFIAPDASLPENVFRAPSTASESWPPGWTDAGATDDR